MHYFLEIFTKKLLSARKKYSSLVILAKNKNLLTDKTDITDFLLLEIHPRHILSALSVLSVRKRKNLLTDKTDITDLLMV